MNQPSLPRPRQVTLAAWFIMVGSAVVVAMVFDRIAGLHSLETRASVERFLAEPPGDTLDIGVQGVLTALRTISMVAAGCATAAAILGYHVLKRSRSARLALTVLAVPLFLTGLVTGGFVSSVVAASAVLLWLQPARDWFNGVKPPPPAVPAGSTAHEVTMPPAGTGPVWPPPLGAAAEQPAGVQGAHAVPTAKRPGAVVWACVLTWVFSAVTALGMTAGAIAIALRPDLMFDEVRRQNPELAEQGVSDDLLATATFVMAGFVVLWCLSAVVLAVLVWRRVAWARIALIVCAATCAALSLLGALLGAFLLVFTLVASVVTVALLVRPGTAPWFARSTG